MKKLTMFVGMLIVCLTPIGARAQCGGCGGSCGVGAGGTVVAVPGAFYAHATIVPLSQIQSVNGNGSVTVSSTAHDVGINGANSGQVVNVSWSGSIDVNETIITGGLDTHTGLIVCDTSGHWSHTFSSSSGVFLLPAGHSYTAHVVSSVSDVAGQLKPLKPNPTTSPSTFSVI